MLTLADALEALTNSRPIATTVITEAVIDSRQVIPGSLFVAIPGEKVDGHDFLKEAFRRHRRRAPADCALLAPQTGPARDWHHGQRGKIHHQGNDRRGVEHALSH